MKSTQNSGHKDKKDTRFCRWCGGYNDRSPLVICSQCEKIRKERQDFLRSSRKSAGKCVDCGDDALPGRIRCGVCTKKQRIYKKKYREKQARNLKQGGIKNE